jgi:hypothetical protein
MCKLLIKNILPQLIIIFLNKSVWQEGIIDRIKKKCFSVQVYTRKQS